MREMVGGCCVCSDDRGWPENPLVYCDGQSCTVAVHQACYGIVTVPTGPWYCRKCESQERSVKVKCELCPSKYGALKRTDNSGWAHVVCALYIPEVRFGNVTTMEPIQLQLIPTERFNKVCYICEENGKPSNATVGACMQCNKSGCKQQFHVTCAQGLGLLCEEAGNYLDNVKYCGYCQHHYSKLKKGGNVKTIPPYKPISTDNHLSDSSSEKETEPGSSASVVKAPPPPQPPQNPPASSTSQSSSSSKRKSSSSSKTTTSSSKSSNSSSKSSTSSSSHQKTVHNSSSSKTDKPKVINSNVKSAKSAEDSVAVSESVEKTDKTSANSSIKDVKVDSEIDSKDNKEKSSKKRKANSRTPTPISVVPSDSVSSTFSSVVNTSTDINTIIGTTSSNTTVTLDKKDNLTISSESDKPKKAKIESTQSSIQVNQPIVALTPLTAAAVKSASPSTANTDAIISATSQTTAPNQSIIQTTPTQPINSLVVSVPLVNATLSSQTHIINNQASVVTAAPSFAHLSAEHSSGVDSNTLNSIAMTRDNSNQNSGIITSEMSGGGLKITYEKQAQVTNNLQVELERITPASIELPAKRSRSQSGEKSEKSGRSKSKRIGANNQVSSAAPINSKRGSRSQNATSPPQPPGAFASISQNRIKDSPPSSPSSESQGPPVSGRRTKGRKSAPASVPTSTNNSKDSKDIKLFQNGVHAPHMMGNQLNPNSNMAQKMSDHLNSELEAHSIFNPSESSNIVGPQLHHRVIASARASSAGSSTASGGSGLSSMLSGAGGAIPQTLDQLLERQWEQGSQFLMEQAQHFDIASLLSCLHQLRAENLRLEEHVSSLLQRRDHLLAVNARLAIPLTGQPATPQSSHPHTVNNIHPAVASSHSDIARPSRHGAGYSTHPQGSAQHAATPLENGLPSDPNQAYQHRSPATSQPQPSPTVRHSPAGSGYPGSGLIRQSADTSGRSAPRPQPYPMYQGPGPSAQQQMVIRREPDIHHQPSSKPS